MADNDCIKKTTINGVDVIEDGDVTHFVVSDEETSKNSSETCKKDEKTSFFGKIFNWFRKSKVKPYVKVRDLADPFGDRINDPFDADAGSDGAMGAEIGIKIDF